MDRQTLKAAAVLVCALAWAGCNGGAREPVRLDLTGVEPTADVSDLAAVLDEAVDAAGRVVPQRLAKVSARLDAQLRRMALAGPTSRPELFPTYGDRWAFWYNARAGWSIKLAELAGFPRRVPPAAMRARQFDLDGRKLSLEGIDEILLAEARRTGDFRLAACAPGVTVDCASLPKTPCAAADFAARMDEALSRLVLDERRFVLAVDERQVRVPPMLWDCRDLVAREYRRRTGSGDASFTTALSVHLSRLARRRLAQGIGYVAVGAALRGELVLPGRKVFMPGKVGRVELP